METKKDWLWMPFHKLSMSLTRRRVNRVLRLRDNQRGFSRSADTRVYSLY